MRQRWAALAATHFLNSPELMAKDCLKREPTGPSAAGQLRQPARLATTCQCKPGVYSQVVWLELPAVELHAEPLATDGKAGRATPQLRATHSELCVYTGRYGRLC